MPTATGPSGSIVVTAGFQAPIAVRPVHLPQAPLHMRGKVVRQNPALFAWSPPKGVLFIQTIPVAINVTSPGVEGARAVATASCNAGYWTSDVIGTRATASASVNLGIPIVAVTGSRANAQATGQPGAYISGVGGVRPTATASVSSGHVSVSSGEPVSGEWGSPWGGGWGTEVANPNARAQASIIHGVVLINSTAPSLGPYLEDSTSLLIPYYETDDPDLTPYTESDELLLTAYNE